MSIAVGSHRPHQSGDAVRHSDAHDEDDEAPEDGPRPESHQQQASEHQLDEWCQRSNRHEERAWEELLCL